MNGKGEARAKLDAYGVDSLCDDIGQRKSLTAIAKEQGVSIGSLLTWIEANPERSARVREARQAMARVWDEEAEEEIRSAADEFGLRKAKELAHHLRWRASKIGVREYGDRMQLAGDPEQPLHGVSDADLDRMIAEKLSALQGGGS